MSSKTSQTVTSTTSNVFKPSLQLQTKRSTTRAFANSLPSSSQDAAEARYWWESFGLGKKTGGTLPQFAHVRKVTLSVSSAALVHQIVYSPSITHKKENNKDDAKKGPNSTSTLAVVSGPRVQLYGTTPLSSFHRLLTRHSLPSENEDIISKPDRQIPTGGHLALTAAYRQGDGGLIAIGTEHGLVRVVNATSRATLCTFATQNTLSIRSVQWFRNGQHLLSAGDDAVLRVWQLSQASVTSTSQAVLELPGHGDAIRSVVLWQDAVGSNNWPHRNLAATGSYDHTIRIWNLDCLENKQEEQEERVEATDCCMSVLNHGSPVEALLLMPSAKDNVPVWLVSTGGTTVKVWNMLTGACVSTTNCQHSKTITSLLGMKTRPLTNAPNHDSHDTSWRLVTAGLDGFLRIHAWDSRNGQIQLLLGVKVDPSSSTSNASVSQSAITSLNIDASQSRLAIGMMSGKVVVRQKGPSITSHKRKREPPAGTYAFFTRGVNASANTGDFVVGSSSDGAKRRKLRAFDQALKQFRYGDALDEALETRVPQAVVAVLEELGKRRGLTIALSNRDEESLEPVLSFTVRYISRPRFAALLIGVANKLIDIYGDISGQSETIDELFGKLLPSKINGKYKQ